MSRRGWNPTEHPRYPNGRFRPKLSHSLRLSSRSVSYNAGARIPIVPGRLTLYTGALIRVERTSTAPGLLSGAADKLIDGAVVKSGNSVGAQRIASALKGETVNIGGVTVQRSAIINSPTVRVSQRSGSVKSTAATGDLQTASTITRAPNRKPRTRTRKKVTASNAGKALQGTRVQT